MKYYDIWIFGFADPDETRQTIQQELYVFLFSDAAKPGLGFVQINSHNRTGTNLSDRARQTVISIANLKYFKVSSSE